MATISNSTSPTQTNVAFIGRWENMLQNDDGARFSVAQYTDKSVQVVGTFGGATLAFEGSNDGVNWSTLSDPQGNPLTFTAAKIEMVAEATLFVRPRITGGDGTTSLSVYVLMKE
jgi:hypothetical protein